MAAFSAILAKVGIFRRCSGVCSGPGHVGCLCARGVGEFGRQILAAVGDVVKAPYLGEGLKENKKQRTQIKFRA